MSGLLSSKPWLQALKRKWQLYRLADPTFRFMFEPAPTDEWVALDCQTTGLDLRKDEIISIEAVRINGNRIMTSERLELLVRPERGVSAESVRFHQLREQDLADGLPADEAMKRLMHFIGSRPLVGYYLEFDLAMVERTIRPLLGIGLPQPRIEVSGLYYDYKLSLLPSHRQHGVPYIDLHFATIMDDLDLPQAVAHEPLNDAVRAALAFVKLRQLQGVA
ncbi:MAG: 3'-5' exonuclease [Comamonadaceae bacterium]|nr:3'-5' exonuclease [Comamonadaceae bacterium]